MNKRVFSVAVLIAMPIASLASIVNAADLLSPDRSIQDAVDHYVNQRISESKVTPAKPTTDVNLIRRTTLDLVGRIPTLQEVRAFVESTEAAKREKLTDRLIDSTSFVRHQTNEFDAMLMYGTGRNLQAYLKTAFESNRSWDDMFRDMLLGDQKDENQRSATEFVRSRARDLDKLANQTSVAFFGINVSCAKCHDHPLVSEWTQEHFFGMKSFFSRTFENGDFIGERDYGIVKYKTTSGEEKTARLMFLSGAVVDEPETKEPSDADKKNEKKQLEELKKKKQPPSAPKFSRRTQLVDVALRDGENRFFAKSIVNRLWYRFYGRGLVSPVDQMHPENAPSHPDLLDWLARDLIAHKYDLRRLIRGLVLTQTYARSSRWDSAERPDADLFAVANVRPLSPHQYAATLRFASMNPDYFASKMKSEDLSKRIDGVENAARGLASSFEQPQDDFQISVTEALLFSNGDRIMREVVRDASDSLVGKLKTIEDDKEAVETAIWNIYQREPDEEEAQALLRYLSERPDRRVEALQQIVWAMLASSECRFNY